MGAAKREMERMDELRDHANGFLVQSNAFHECRHGTLINSGDEDAQKLAYAIGTKSFKDGMVDGTRQELMDAIKSAIDDTGSHCAGCEKVDRE